MAGWHQDQIDPIWTKFRVQFFWNQLLRAVTSSRALDSTLIAVENINPGTKIGKTRSAPLPLFLCSLQVDLITFQQFFKNQVDRLTGWHHLLTFSKNYLMMEVDLGSCPWRCSDYYWHRYALLSCNQKHNSINCLWNKKKLQSLLSPYDPFRNIDKASTYHN